jgi:gas vesicle protein
MSDHNDNFFKGFLLGGMIGAVLGVLFAPKPGREIRQELGDETEKLVSKLKTDLEKAKETFEEGKQKIIEKLNIEKFEESATPQVSEEEEPPPETTRKKSTRK